MEKKSNLKNIECHWGCSSVLWFLWQQRQCKMSLPFHTATSALLFAIDSVTLVTCLWSYNLKTFFQINQQHHLAHFLCSGCRAQQRLNRSKEWLGVREDGDTFFNQLCWGMEYVELRHEGAVNSFGAKEQSAQTGTGRIQFNQFHHQRYCHVGVHLGTNDLETKAVECFDGVHLLCRCRGNISYILSWFRSFV